MSRTEFNEDNAKIDAALGALASSVDGKTVRRHSTNAKAQMNSSSAVYTVIALIKAS